MNLIILTNTDFIAEHRVRLDDDRFEHIRNIHRSNKGDTVKIGQINGNMGTGSIVKMDDHGVEIDIALTESPPAKLPLTVVLSLPRPKMIRRIFRSVAELGIEELIVINSYKVEKSFWQSPALQDEKVAAYLTAGLQQAKDTMPPKISFKRLFKPFVEDELPSLIKGKRALIAHPATGNACPPAIDEAAVLAIGPEGGFTPYEVEKFMATGFEGIHLGPRILRVENALTALTSKLYL